MVKSVGKYDLYKTLGQGSFGKVKYAVHKETNEAFAIKILDKEKILKKNMGNQIRKEISIMKMIQHHHVIAVKDVFATATKIFIVLELVEGGELFDKIVDVGKLAEEDARFYFKQLIEGMEYCHDQGICHRDLKPENLLLDSDGNIKVSDFGLATLYIGDATAEGSSERSELLHTTCGTPNYVAPEVLSNQGYDGRMADVWSMGVILYVLLAGFLPFEEKTIAALFSKIKLADYSYPSWFSSDAKDLLDGILVANPTKRLTLKQVKNHVWLQGFVPNAIPLTKDFVRPSLSKENSATDDMTDHNVVEEDDTNQNAMPKVEITPTKVSNDNHATKELQSQSPGIVIASEIPQVPVSSEKNKGIFSWLFCK